MISTCPENITPDRHATTFIEYADVPTRTTQGYNSRNQLTSMLVESTAAPAQFPANLTQYDYDNNGNRSLVVDTEGNAKTWRCK